MTEGRSAWNCPVCGTPHRPGSTDLKFPGFDIYRCPCGLGYSGLAMAGERGQSYNAAYYQHVRYADKAGRDAYAGHLAGIFDGCLKECAPPTGGRRLIDVGCATGDFVGWARDHGWEASGIDASPEAVETARGRGLAVTVGNIEDIGDSVDRPYDVITMWDVLEHLPDPAGALSTLRRISKPGVVLVLKTVSRTSIIEAMARLAYRGSLGVISAPLRRIYVPGHLYCFTGPVLHRLLARCGWAVGCAGQTDTPSRALTGFPPLGAALGLAARIQRTTGRCYELFAACHPKTES